MDPLSLASSLSFSCDDKKNSDTNKNMWSDCFDHRLKGIKNTIECGRSDSLPGILWALSENPFGSWKFLVCFKILSDYSPRTKLIQKLYPGSTHWSWFVKAYDASAYQWFKWWKFHLTVLQWLANVCIWWQECRSGKAE